MKHWLAARQPDVVGLQELKVTDDQFPSAELESVGYRACVYGQKSWNGVAILTRLDRPEPQVEQRGLPGQEELGARLVTARVGELTFCTIYCPNGKTVEHEDYVGKLAWMDSLAEYVEKQLPTDEPVVLCGDFNVCPGALDSWNEKAHAGHIFHTDAERSRFARLLDGGLRDVFRERFPAAQEFSWWDYRGGAFHKRQGLRIDFLLASNVVMDRARSVEIDREYRKKQDGHTASDHAPVFADLD